jgi:hypothetical protein
MIQDLGRIRSINLYIDHHEQSPYQLTNSTDCHSSAKLQFANLQVKFVRK